MPPVRSFQKRAIDKMKPNSLKRGFTNPSPKTDSAREAVKSFYCELCSKGYARMNEYESHLSSYDHSHKQRLKDMRQLTKDPLASSRARRAEMKANNQSGLISIKIGGDIGASNKKSGFKKAGFKSAFSPTEDSSVTVVPNNKKELESLSKDRDEALESDTEDEGYEIYNPRHPTE
ncbi:putative g patch domain-containing protein 8 [Golovinomyces cichoracearum]|uniref:Putative g patch domain-containing protein 8 n=1 Tax=Golovinomyces cichoracearum TaxID=62708 RepID=A0A420IZ76_9PEZI|nr:putative g patch domain-containing protein 8 [Golovinomyces cichoracearum]